MKSILAYLTPKEILLGRPMEIRALIYAFIYVFIYGRVILKAITINVIAMLRSFVEEAEK